MGYLKSIGTVIIYIGFFLTVITFLPGIPPEVEVSEYRYNIYFLTRTGPKAAINVNITWTNPSS